MCAAHLLDGAGVPILSCRAGFLVRVLDEAVYEVFNKPVFAPTALNNWACSSVCSTVSSEIDYGAHNNVMSGAESCAKDESKDSGTTFISSMSGSFLNCVSYPDKLERYNSKPGSEISEDFTQLNGSCCLIPCAACPGVSASSSADLQISEVASCHKHASASLSENDGTLDIMNPKKMPYTESLGVVNSSKFNLDTDGNNTEEWV